MIYSNDYIKNIPLDATLSLQQLINTAIEKRESLFINDGIYNISALFIKSSIEIILDKNAILKGIADETKYNLIKTRVAGIDMDWYPAIINIIDTLDVKISGGTIIGAGSYFYNKYWGKNRLGGMRKLYDAKGLRWACDYDCMRVRNMLVSNSKNIEIKNIKFKDSGFWNLHVLYSNNILVDNVEIISDDINAPSTDGIDIDSSYDVLVKDSKISVNDDSISIKSGRDYDGYMVNKPSYNVKIENVKFYSGYGISMGSELSAGIKDINISNCKFINTDTAFRIKSSKRRGGYVKNIKISNIDATNVKYLIHIFLDWNKEYNNIQLPEKPYPKYYDKIAYTPSNFNNLTKISDIDISNIKSNYSKNYEGISRIFTIIGYENEYIDNINIKDSIINMKEYGIIKYAKNINVYNSKLDYLYEHIEKNDDFDNR